MLIPKEDIQAAKEAYGDNAIEDIVNYLKIENFDERSKKGSCPFGHIDKTPSLIWNPTTQNFHCFSCSRNYDIIDMYLDQGKSFLEATQELFSKKEVKEAFANQGIKNFNFSEVGLKTKKEYKYPDHIQSQDRSQVEQYLGLRKLSIKTLDYADVQQDNGGNIVFHYYDQNDVLLTVKYRPSHKVDKGKENKAFCQSGKDTSPVLYNMNRIVPNKPLVITEGEIDCLSVIESGYTNVVSIPFGASSTTWIDYNWEWLEQFSKIIIWSDSDEAGERMRKEVCPRLGSWRTYYISLDLNSQDGKRKLKDANEVLYYYGKEKVIDIINNPIEMPVEGIINLANVSRFEIEKAEGLYSGLKPLDKKIYKFVFGTLAIITGRAGEGKSVFANQVAICQALQQGYDTFVFSGELPAPNLKDWVETNLIGREYITMKDEHIRKFNEQARLQVINWYNGRIWMYDDSQGSTATLLLKKMEEMARRFGTKVFLIDNLMTVDLECDNESLLQAQKEFVKKLVNFAKMYNVLVFLVAHPRKTGGGSITMEDVSGSQDIVNLGHYLISVHRYTDDEKEGVIGKNGEYLKGYEPKIHDSVIRMLKNRITGSQNFNIELDFDVPSYRFYSDIDELWFRYKWNKDRNQIPNYDPKQMEGNSPL